MKRDNLKKYKKEHSRMIEDRKEQELFIEKLKKMSPEEQEKCVEKLKYEIGLIQAKIRDVDDSFPEYRISKKERTIILVASTLVGLATGAAASFWLESSVDRAAGIGVIFTPMGGMVGYLAGLLFYDMKGIDKVKDIHGAILYHKRTKLCNKELKLSRKLNMIKDFSSAQNREDVQEDVNLASL